MVNNSYLGNTWYWGDASYPEEPKRQYTATSGGGSTGSGDSDGGCAGRHLKPSNVLWGVLGEGRILDDDHVGGVRETDASGWCAEAVRGGNLEVWHSVLAESKHAVALLNRSPEEDTVTAEWGMLGLDAGREMLVRDVWAGKTRGKYAAEYSAAVPAFGAVLLVLS